MVQQVAKAIVWMQMSKPLLGAAFLRGMHSLSIGRRGFHFPEVVAGPHRLVIEYSKPQATSSTSTG